MLCIMSYIQRDQSIEKEYRSVVAGGREEGRMGRNCYMGKGSYCGVMELDRIGGCPTFLNGLNATELLL